MSEQSAGVSKNAIRVSLTEVAALTMKRGMYVYRRGELEACVWVRGGGGCSPAGSERAVFILRQAPCSGG